MSRALADLSDRMRPLAVELLARCAEARICVLIVDTLRTKAEHEQNLQNGTSWTTLSNHLDGREFRRTGMPGSDAIDIAPYEIWQLHGADKLQWDVADPVWQRLGEIGEGVGLVWGGRFGPPAKPDLGHFEHPRARLIDGPTGVRA
jgi:lambda repressor-like predicted transcriptional regulator